MRTSLNRQKIEKLARILQDACDQGLVSPAEYRTIHAQFLSYDGAGNVWTFALLTRRWNRAENQMWVDDQPPAKLEMDSTVVQEIERLKQELAQNTQPKSNVPPPATQGQPSVPTPSTQDEATAGGGAILIAAIVVILGIAYLAGAFGPKEKDIDRKSIEEVLTTPESGPSMPPADDLPTLGQ